MTRSRMGRLLPSRLTLTSLITLSSVLVSSVLVLTTGTAWAGDPFRNQNPVDIGTKTEQAFRTIFEQGNYALGENYLKEAIDQESGEPMIAALQASLVYTSWQFEKDDNQKKVLLEDFRKYAEQTRSVAEKLVEKNPLRGNLYTAVGYFLEGAYIVSEKGALQAAPQALGKLQQVFQALSAAEKVNREDPELNLIKGYMDLLLAVNLPFSDPEQAIQRLEKYASPQYLSYRGIAIAYRDLRKTDEAMVAVDKALELTPNNPDLFHLKAQILVLQNKNQESLVWFEKALALRKQLLPAPAGQIAYEHCRAQSRVDQQSRDCKALLHQS